MSVILDALKKSQKERDAKQPAAADAPPAPADSPAGEGAAGGARRRLLIFGGVGLVVLLLAGGGAAWLLLPGLFGGEPAAPQVAEAEQPAPEQETPPGTAAPETGTVPPPEPEPEPEPEAQTEEKPEPEAPPVAKMPWGLSLPAPSIGAASPDTTPAPEPAPKTEPAPKPAPEPAEQAAVSAPPPAPPKPEAPARPQRLEPEPAAPVASPAAPAEVWDLLGEAQAAERRGDLAEAIRLYSRVVRQDPEAADAYVGRAWSFLETGRPDRAAEDFSRAIRHAADPVEAYFGRAWAFEQAGKTDRAMQDYSRVLQLAPEHVHAAFARGALAFQSGRFDRATADFATVMQAADGDMAAFGALWLYVSRERAGEDGGRELALWAAQNRLGGWPSPILNLFLGRAGEERVLRAARAGDGEERAQRLCVAHFFLGERSLLQDDRAAAVAHFRKAVETGAQGYRQYWAAKAELAKLQGDSD